MPPAHRAAGLLAVLLIASGCSAAVFDLRPARQLLDTPGATSIDSLGSLRRGVSAQFFPVVVQDMESSRDIDTVEIATENDTLMDSFAQDSSSAALSSDALSSDWSSSVLAAADMGLIDSLVATLAMQEVSERANGWLSSTLAAIPKPLASPSDFKPVSNLGDTQLEMSASMAVLAVAWLLVGVLLGRCSHSRIHRGEPMTAEWDARQAAASAVTFLAFATCPGGHGAHDRQAYDE